MLKVLLGLTFLAISISLNLRVPSDNHLGRFIALMLLFGSLLFAIALYFCAGKRFGIFVLLLGCLVLMGNILFFRYLNSIEIKLHRFDQAVAYIHDYYRKNDTIPDSAEVEKLCNFPKGMEIYVRKEDNDLVIWTNVNYGYGFSYFTYSPEKARAVLVE